MPLYCTSSLWILRRLSNEVRQLPGGRWHDDGHLTLDDLRRIHESVKEEIMHESESVLQWVCVHWLYALNVKSTVIA